MGGVGWRQISSNGSGVTTNLDVNQPHDPKHKERSLHALPCTCRSSSGKKGRKASSRQRSAVGMPREANTCFVCVCRGYDVREESLGGSSSDDGGGGAAHS